MSGGAGIGLAPGGAAALAARRGRTKKRKRRKHMNIRESRDKGRVRIVSQRCLVVMLPVAALLALQLAGALPAQAAPGALDPTFGTKGKVTTDFGSGFDGVNAVAVQVDGKIVAAGATGAPDFALARYNTTGALDPTFGTGGKVTTDFGSVFDGVNAVAVQVDGKIVAAGTGKGPEDTDFALARYNTDGTLDTTFGSGGKVTTDFLPVSHDSDQAFALVVQPDGKIVAGGIGVGRLNPAGGPGGWDFALARYDTHGTLDPTFGTLGKVTTDFSNNLDWAFALAQQADGKLVAAGFASVGSGQDGALARYNIDGTLDTTFGSGGKITTDLGTGSDIFRAVASQTDGRILAAGSGLARYNSNGTLDTTFGTGGKATTGFTGFGMALQADGKIVTAGGVGGSGSNENFALARYTTSGTLDSSFGTNGTASTDFARRNDHANGMALQAGKIVAAGYATTASGQDFALARYLAA